MRQDGALESLEVRGRIQSQFLAEHPMGVAVELEGVCLTVGTVERKHELAADPLAKRLRRNQRLELDDHLGVPPLVQVDGDPFLQRSQAHLLQPRDVGPRERAVRELLERRASPERHRGP